MRCPSLCAAVLFSAIAAFWQGSAAAHVGTGIDVDRQGRVYFSDTCRNRIWRIDPDGRLALVATEKHSDLVVVAEDGSVYFTHDYFDGVFKSSLWQITSDGRVTQLHLAEKDVGHTISKILRHKIDASDGSRYIIRDNRVHRISPEGSDSVIGEGTAGESGGRTTAHAIFRKPISLAVDSQGNVFVVDYGNRSVHKITPTGSVTTVARSSWFWWPVGVAVQAGNVYVLERPGDYWGASGALLSLLADLSGGPRVRKIAADGTVTTPATITGMKQRALAGVVLTLIGASGAFWLIRRRQFRAPR